MNPAEKKLIPEYDRRKSLIKNRLKDFSRLHRGRDKDIFSELCFCILTANSNAVSCDRAIAELKRKNLLLKGSVRQIRRILKSKTRFHNKKACYITEARKIFSNGRGLDIKNRIDAGDIARTREWLVKNIRGLGYKEASHFLRNIGLGQDIAILDRHILKNLKKLGVIEEIPASTGSRKVYAATEDKMRSFSEKIGIPLDELDLLFWSIQTGFVFK